MNEAPFITITSKFTSGGSTIGDRVVFTFDVSQSTTRFLELDDITIDNCNSTQFTRLDDSSRATLECIQSDVEAVVTVSVGEGVLENVAGIGNIASDAYSIEMSMRHSSPLPLPHLTSPYHHLTSPHLTPICRHTSGVIVQAMYLSHHAMQVSILL